jgi:hypothetical protein
MGTIQVSLWSKISLGAIRVVLELRRSFSPEELLSGGASLRRAISTEVNALVMCSAK